MHIHRPRIRVCALPASEIRVRVRDSFSPAEQPTRQHHRERHAAASAPKRRINDSDSCHLPRPSRVRRVRRSNELAFEMHSRMHPKCIRNARRPTDLLLFRLSFKGLAGAARRGEERERLGRIKYLVGGKIGEGGGYGSGKQSAALSFCGHVRYAAAAATAAWLAFFKTTPRNAHFNRIANSPTFISLGVSHEYACCSQ